MTLPAWRALLTRLGDRLESLGVTLHEIEESLPADATPGSGDAAYWLERAGDGRRPIGRRSWRRLTGWTAPLDAERATRLPALVPSLADCVRWASATSERLRRADMPSR